jgi:hypothetical protein
VDKWDKQKEQKLQMLMYISYPLVESYPPQTIGWALSAKVPAAQYPSRGSTGKSGQFDFVVSRSIISTKLLTPVALYPAVTMILKSPKIKIW